MTAAFFTGADTPTEVPLKRRLKRAERGRQFKALALVLPLLLFLLFTFLGPLAGMLWRSVDDWEVRQVLPHTVAALADWDGKDVLDEKAYAALAGDIQAARASGTVAIASKRLNYALNGFRTILASTARNLKAAPEPGTAKETLVRINPAWGERATWAAIKGAAANDQLLPAGVARPELGTWTARSSRPRRIRRSTATCSPAPLPSASASRRFA